MGKFQTTCFGQVGSQLLIFLKKRPAGIKKLDPGLHVVAEILITAISCSSEMKVDQCLPNGEEFCYSFMRRN